jgi:hypothetical protein
MHGLGVRYRKDCGGPGRCRTCLNGTDRLPHRAAFVISWRITTSLRPYKTLARLLRLATKRLFTTLDGDSARYSPTKRRFGPPPTA